MKLEQMYEMKKYSIETKRRGLRERKKKENKVRIIICGKMLKCRGTMEVSYP
jgi:hypothetical protein